MTYKLIDTYIDKVIGEYSSPDQAQKAFDRLYPEAGRYVLEEPKVTKPRGKSPDVKKESN